MIKLTDTQVSHVKWLHEHDAANTVELATLYGVSRWGIKNIVFRRRRKSIEPAYPGEDQRLALAQVRLLRRIKADPKST